jgi:hypothetical protein
LSFYEGVGVRVLKIEESELLCTDSTALDKIHSGVWHQTVGAHKIEVLVSVLNGIEKIYPFT